MEEGKGKEMKEAVVHDGKGYMSSSDLNVGDNMMPTVERNTERQNYQRR